jgi:predicted RNase H-like HicB family nuclease
MSNKTVEYYVNLPHKITLKKWTDEEESYYVVQIPELPGCMSDGETIKEALKNIIDAKTGWIEACIDIGREIPIPQNSIPIIENLGEYTEEEIEDGRKACIELKNIMSRFYEKHKDVTFLSDKRKK